MEESCCDLIKVLCQNFPERTEEEHKTLVRVQIQTWHFQIQIQNVTATSTLAVQPLFQEMCKSTCLMSGSIHLM